MVILFPLTGFAKDKVLLADLIQKSERIPVSFNTLSAVSRIPHVPNTAREVNIKTFSRTTAFFIVEAAVVELNAAFKTEKFYRLSDTYEKAEEFKKQGFTLWVILEPKGSYSIVSTSGNLRFDMSLGQTFYSVDAQDKINKSRYSMKTIYSTCSGESVFINLPLDSMMSKLPANCAFDKIMAGYKKNIVKLAAAQQAKKE